MPSEQVLVAIVTALGADYKEFQGLHIAAMDQMNSAIESRKMTEVVAHNPGLARKALVADAFESLLSTAPQGAVQRYFESHIALQIGAYTACLALVRWIIEAVCLDQGLKIDPLRNAIRELSRKGIANERLANWIAKVVEVANESAHSGEVLREDAEDALSAVGAILIEVYVAKPRSEAFSKRRRG
ncbi:hypothetical protein Val02_14130 [Virgisporangium aliadipatigenens]|uniref:DUF4145 domain-containing protein n=2 Tax=Virgisporangium aliadipatigenens TaxID=741659 RepID=A0A8J3YHS2_9ACTN|nr:hypothetical protein Val02_14130 [Virgisporangium aliadipatigenens]